MIKCSIAIPARIASSRLPGKMLKKLGGKPVIQHVIERALQVRNCSQVYVVTDCVEIVGLAQSLGIQGLMTSPSCHSGTDRIVSILKEISGDWIFNVQGDEPFIDPQWVEQLIERASTTEAEMLTGVYRLKQIDDVLNPNIVKTVLDNKGQAIYFSRSPIPFVRGIAQDSWLNETTFWGHMGIYGYRRDLLEHYNQLKSSYLEKAESLEQLRFIANGYKIATFEAPGRSVAIDTQEDLDKAEALIAGRK
ncbi:MAG: 3-deoxy-manno-octulosonate cytidylyltransferase [bacterium]